jgi:hypothetical protein
MNTYQTYIDYFENIAIQHKHILHNPADANNKKFYRINIEETVTGFRNIIAEKAIVMVLINYAFDVDNTDPSNSMRNVKFGFIIMGWHQSGDFDAETSVMVTCEEVVHDIVARAKVESRLQTADENSFWYNSLDENVDFYVTPASSISDSNYSGFLVTGEFRQHFSCSIRPNAWTDQTTLDNLISNQ